MAPTSASGGSKRTARGRSCSTSVPTAQEALPRSLAHFERRHRADGQRGPERRTSRAGDTQYPVLADEEEAALNREGYRLLAEKNTKEAVRIFEQNVVAHPHSANAHDSLSDAYEAAGDLEKAIELARKALDVLPRDPSKDQALKDRVRASATEKLKRLGHPVSGPR